jgi:hypothetical protein
MMLSFDTQKFQILMKFSHLVFSLALVLWHSDSQDRKTSLWGTGALGQEQCIVGALLNATKSLLMP